MESTNNDWSNNQLWSLWCVIRHINWGITLAFVIWVKSITKTNISEAREIKPEDNHLFFFHISFSGGSCLCHAGVRTHKYEYKIIQINFILNFNAISVSLYLVFYMKWILETFYICLYSKMPLLKLS